MEKQKSFSEFIRNEILNYSWTNKQLEILFYSFITTNGEFKDNKFILSTTLIEHEAYFNNLFKRIYELNVKPSKLKTKLKYTLNNIDEFKIKYFNQQSQIVLSDLENTKAFLAGVFLGKGWVSSPSSRFYNMEFRIKTISHSLSLQEVIESFGVKTKTILKNNWYLTYIKRALDISDLINAMNASQAVMIFENSRISRDFMSSYAKLDAIENYNLEKTHIASIKQIESINKLKTKTIYKSLTREQKIVADLRVENSNMSLSELCYLFNNKYNKNVSKSTINNWLKKIMMLSNK